MIDEYFNLLEDWKLLPAYKLETRIDSLVGFALPRVMSSIYGIDTKVLIPELPIRLATVRSDLEKTRHANRSYKVDFYIRSQLGENFFIEFKADSRSRREGQDKYLQKSMDVGMRRIIDGILTISSVTSYREKYDHLLVKLKEAGLLDRGLEDEDTDDDIKVIYIQPRKLPGDKNKEVLEFPRLAKSIRECFPTDELMMRLSASLEKWEIE